MKTALTAAILSPALLLAAAAQAADYPIQRRHAIEQAEPYPTCHVGRFANMRYVPPLATHYWIRPVFVSMPVPCEGRYR